MASPALDREAVNQAIARGSDFLKQGMLDEAQKAFRAALLLDGENARVLALLGLTYFKGGQYDQARPIYEELVERAPTDASHRLNLGLVYLKLGDSDKAIGSLEASRALDPSQGRAISYLGLAYARAGRYAEAYRSFILAGQKDLATEIEINLTAAERESIQQQLLRAQGGVEPRTKPPKEPPKPVATVSQIGIPVHAPPADVAPASQDQSGSVDVQFSRAGIPVATQDQSGSVDVQVSMPDIQIEKLAARSNQDSAPPAAAVESGLFRTPTPPPGQRTPTPPAGSPGVGDWRRIEREKFERQRAEKAAAQARRQAELEREQQEQEQERERQQRERERQAQERQAAELRAAQAKLRDSDPDVGIKESETAEPAAPATEIIASKMTDSLQFVLPQSEAVPAPAEGQSMISRAVEVATPSSAASASGSRVGWGNTPPVPLSQLATELLVRPEDGDEAFEVTAGGSLIIRVKDRVLTRLDGIHVSGGELEYEPTMRRSRGKDSGEKFDFGGTRLHTVSGTGYLVAVPGDKKFTAVSLDDDIFYLREDLVYAFEATLRWENGNVPGLRGKLPVVQFRGDGAIALKTAQQLVRVKLPAQGVLFVDAMRLAGWIGRVIPRAVVPPTDGPMGEVCVECTGEGVVLIDPAAAPVVTADRERRPSLDGRTIQEAHAQKQTPPPPPQPAPIELDVVKKADWLADDEEDDAKRDEM